MAISARNGTFEGAGILDGSDIVGGRTRPFEPTKKKAKEEEAAKKAKEEAEKAKRPAWQRHDGHLQLRIRHLDDTCTVASVGDAGTGTPGRRRPAPSPSPTTSGGFSGASCTVTPDHFLLDRQLHARLLGPLDGGSGLPMITASYGGDSRHSPSEGSTPSRSSPGRKKAPARNAPSAGQTNSPETVLSRPSVPHERTTVDGPSTTEGQETESRHPNSPIADRALTGSIRPSTPPMLNAPARRT